MKIDSFQKALGICHQQGVMFFELIQNDESANQECSVAEVREIMRRNIEIMKSTIEVGLQNQNLSITSKTGDDSRILLERYKENKNLPMNMTFGKILAYAVAMMEENLNMGKIVACPTAGACGIVPAVIIAYSEELGFDMEKQIDALIVAGGVGKIVARKVALAGAVAGCQAECGVASAMAAAAATYLMNGSNEQIFESVSLALKNILGLVCDPVAGMVEIPCVKRNGFLAMHGVSASEMALAGVKSAIPVDEVVDALKQVGSLMSPLLKECSQAGLATTQSGLDIKDKIIN